MMDERLPEAEDAILQGLVGKWISGRDDVSGQIDGLEAVVSALGSVLDTIMGAVATRATLSRALVQAAPGRPTLERLRGAGRGLDFPTLRTEMASEAPEMSAEALASLLREWLGVLHWLLGPVLPSLLQQAEVALAKRESAGNGEEGQ